MWWKYACSSDSHVPMTTVVLGDIGGDTLTSHTGVARMHINTHMHTRTTPLSQLESPLFAPKVFQSSLAAHLTPPLLFVPSLSTGGRERGGGGCHFLKFPQVKRQLTSRPLWYFKKLLSHRRPPSVSQLALSCPFSLFVVHFLSFFPSLILFFFSSVLFFSTANIERDLIDKRCSISQQISSFVCLWLCLESFSAAASSSTWCFSEAQLWDPPHIQTHTHTFHKHLAGRWERQFIKSVICYFFSKGLW